LYRYSVIQSSEFYDHNPLCCFSSVYCCFVLDSVWELLDTPSYVPLFVSHLQYTEYCNRKRL